MFSGKASFESMKVHEGAQRGLPPNQGMPAMAIIHPFAVLLTAILVGLFAYQLLFDYLAEDMRLQLASVLIASSVLVAICGILGRAAPWSMGILGALSCFPVIWLLGDALYLQSLQSSIAIRFGAPLLFGIVVVQYYDMIQPKVLLWLIIGSLIVATPTILLHGITTVDRIARLSSFTGGHAGSPHSSAYMLALLALLSHQIGLSGRIATRVTRPMMALCFVLLLGLRVTTPVIMLIVYWISFSYLRRNVSLSRKSWILFGCVVTIVVALVAHELTQKDIAGGTFGTAQIGSGRLSSWQFRLQLLADRDAGQMFLGTGLGSDLVVSPVWWWEAKDSHNDLLSVATESGLLGVTLLVVAFALFFRHAGREALPLLAFFITGSLLSNGLLFRPFLGMMFWIGVSLAYRRAAETSIRTAETAFGRDG